MLASEEQRVALAHRRLAETRLRKAWWPWSRARPALGGEDFTLRAFLTGANTLKPYDIARLEPSAFALPGARMAEIRGESSMGWTQFVGVMRDGREVSFGSTFHWECFAMPDGYTAADIVRIRPHERAPEPLYRERPFFTCYVPGLQASAWFPAKDPRP
ncbi:MAG: hypothetical protein H0X64_06520 [Gemmatimonadaceae bacterium]|nr:hypothetical protein [Gemmatimonadaceae bacterium]